jgi:branched-chain amino acid transport system ATP-binding protein
MGAFARGRAARSGDGLVEVLDLFAELEPLLDRPAGLLSGGEQQMLAVGRALMGAPRLLVLDEPSMGLAPRLVARIYDALRALAGRGATLLLAEQNARAALDLADDAVVLATGTVALRGPAAKVRDAPELREVYLGG